MLYSPKQFNKDQLLADLLAVRERLGATGGWSKGAWQQAQAVCIVGAVNVVTGQPMATTVITVGDTDQDKMRMGRLLVAIYMALYGPKAPRDLTISQVAQKIIRFNDGAASHAAVMLLLDRAAERLLQPAEQA